MAPPLKNDCFALPQGVHWTPVREALDHLRASLSAVKDVETVPLDRALGRVLGSDILALRAHPPYPNSAIDGYGFAHSALEQAKNGLPLVEGRSAAGGPFEGSVPTGSAVRILTGARPPDGVDTIVLQEDVHLDGPRVFFEGDIKKGANIRPLGEDIEKDALVLSKGHRLGPHDIGVLASVGVGAVEVYTPLKVALLSTGSELVPAGSEALDHQIFDANRPMLSALLQAWGIEALDLGAISDTRDGVRDALDRASREADVVLSTGGASAGDEDHISAILKEEGRLETWRVAIKPGRPLAMGFWGDVPLFGLPGNPVAAFVCALLFVGPSLRVMQGGAWSEPRGMSLQARFSKRKKPGREEYLRARRVGDGVEVFSSEGSGRISGLSWADGLVALEHDQGEVKEGDLVRYISFSEFRI